MTNSPDDIINLFAQEIQKRTEAGFVLTALAQFDDALGYLIASRLTNLEIKRPKDRPLRVRLFKNRGPLSDTSSKIDLALALGFCDEAMWRDLHALRDIRNAYAHPDGETHFDTPKVRTLMANFSDYDFSAIPRDYFVKKVNSMQDKLKNQLEVAALLTVLSNPQSPDPRDEQGQS